MKRKILVLVIWLVLLTLAVFLAGHVLSLVAKKTQIIGTRSAIAGAMQAEVKQPDSKVSVLINEMLGDNETIELNANQYDAVVDILASRNYQLDVPQPWKPGMTLNDPWGKRFRIIIQRAGGNLTPTVMVTNHLR